MTLRLFNGGKCVNHFNTGFYRQYDKFADDLVSVSSTTFSVVAADANDSFIYFDLGVPIDGDEPIVEFTSAEPYHVFVNGSEVDDRY